MNRFSNQSNNWFEKFGMSIIDVYAPSLTKDSFFHVSIYRKSQKERTAMAYNIIFFGVG